jgi:hypothetical protein
MSVSRLAFARAAKRRVGVHSGKQGLMEHGRLLCGEGDFTACSLVHADRQVVLSHMEKYQTK